MSLILASASPRRKELLQRMGLEFTVCLAQHDETMDPQKDPAQEVQRVSLLKAEAVRALCRKEDVIIAADTVVVCEELVMGKPASQEEAVSMLSRLSGREHQVITGLSVLQGERVETVSVTTTLRFRSLREEEIRAYVATGEPMDKAGAYGIQGKASVFVEGLYGDYYNVMGLPVCTLTTILRSFGIKLLGC
ncbi:MAG: septum formation inhibitor Maf [Oscillospiraceae bacterium]|nr:septum formation inhibitor Maf [Oscillospiraceae bacterium]